MNNFRYYLLLLLIIFIFQVKCKKNDSIAILNNLNGTYDYNNEIDILFANIKFLKNDNDNNYAFLNLPKKVANYNNSTFGKYNNRQFEKWPNNKEDFYSIVDFEFDEDENIYLLDEKNDNTTVFLYKYNINREMKANFTFSKNVSDSLTNLVIDKINNYAYISFYNNANNIEAGIFVKELKVNNNNCRRLVLKETLLLYDEKYNFTNELFNNFPGIQKKVISIALSCDGKYLLFSPLSSRMIYSIKTKKLRDSTKEFISINDVNAAYKNDSSSSLVFSNMGNLYLTGMENKKIYLGNQIDSNLAVFDFKILDKREDNSMEWPTKLSITDGVLYINSKKIEKNTVYTYIYKTLIDDDKSYIYKCAGIGYNWKIIAYIFWGILILIIILVLIFMIIGNELDKNINIKKNK